LFTGSLWAAAALTLLLKAGAVPLPDSSGEEELVDELSRNLLTRSPLLQDCVSLAWLLHSSAICEKFAVCESSMEMLASNNLNLPKIKEEDGCLLSGFNEEKCLRRISSGLFTFQTYLEYVQETFISEKQKVESIYYGTKHLANTMRQMVKNPDAVSTPDSPSQNTLFAKLKTNKKWIEKITIHLILRDFTSFMEKTVRAIRYLKNSRNPSV
uniref:Interleukin-6 n=1 Tax=Pelusios castaneus TaxID=367368 RepID=A0A8C8VJU2_9SAUR